MASVTTTNQAVECAPGQGTSIAQPLLTVIVPVYNEVNTLETILERVYESPVDKQIIVVDDGSTDGTAELVRQLAACSAIEAHFHEVNRGKGRAIRTALEFAKGQYTIIQDGDLEYDPQDYPKLLEPLLAGEADVVYGSRYLNPENDFSGRRPFDLGVKLLNLVVWWLYGKRITDEATCYKVFATETLRAMELQCERFEFCPEVTAKTLLRRLRLIETSVKYAPRSFEQGKKIGMADGLAAVLTLWRFRNRWLNSSHLVSVSGFAKLASICLILSAVGASVSVRAYFRHRGDDSNRVIAVEGVDLQSEFLVSQVESIQSDNYCSRFKVTNLLNRQIQLAVRFPSCGCLSFELDGASILTDEWWILLPGESSIVGMNSQFPSPSQSIDRKFLIDVRDLDRHATIVQKPISVRLAVHLDIEVHPSALQIPLHDDRTTWTRQLHVEVTRTNISEAAELIVELPDELKRFVEVHVRQRSPDVVSENLLRQRYLVELTLRHSLGGRDVQPHLDFLRDCMLRIYLLADSSGIGEPASVHVPIRIQDPWRLEAVESIDFGSVAAGTTVTRTLLISTHDGGNLRLLRADNERRDVLSIDWNDTTKLSSSVVVKASFRERSIGNHVGEFILIPDVPYRPVNIQYQAKVSPNPGVRNDG